MKLEADDWTNVGRLAAYLGAGLFCMFLVYFAAVRLLETELRECWTCSVVQPPVRAWVCVHIQSRSSFSVNKLFLTGEG